MKVAIISPSFKPSAGGISTAHYNLYKQLETHCQVYMLTYNECNHDTINNIYGYKIKKWQIQIAKQVLRLRLRRWTISDYQVTQAILSSWFVVLKLNFRIRKINPDVLITPDHGVPSLFLKKRKTTKLIWSSHHFYKRFHENPLARIYSSHDLHMSSVLEMRGIAKADTILASSNYMRMKLIENGVEDKKIFVLKNTLRIAEEQAVEKTITDDSVLIVYIPSAGSAIKGKRYVVEIVRRLSEQMKKELAFFLSGSVDEATAYELSLLQNKGIAIYAPGKISWEENLKQVAMSTVCVSPTLVENYSMAFLEAKSFGLPIVTFNVGGNAEIIHHGVDGYLVDNFDIEAFIVTTVQLLQDRDKLRQMHKASLLNFAAINKFDPESDLFQA